MSSKQPLWMWVVDRGERIEDQWGMLEQTGAEHSPQPDADNTVHGRLLGSKRNIGDKLPALEDNYSHALSIIALSRPPRLPSIAHLLGIIWNAGTKSTGRHEGSKTVRLAGRKTKNKNLSRGFMLGTGVLRAGRNVARRPAFRILVIDAAC